jgi:CO dehydrogenase maturation factor
MKIVVLGKGGCGKSTISSILAKNLAKKGYKVLVVDTDESNYGLHKQLGVGEPLELMDYLGGKKDLGKRLLESMRQGKPEAMAQMMGGKWTLTDIPENCLARKDGIALMQVGKVKHFGEGCACPMGALARSFLENLVVKDGEVVIVDTEAGVEHIGRGVEKGGDLVLMVVDPSYESLRLSGKVEEMLGEVKKPVYYVINKADKETSEYLMGKLDASKVVTAFSNERRLSKAGLSGREISSRISGAASLTNFVIGKMGA